jgi:CheY-like chemotaxis protein
LIRTPVPVDDSAVQRDGLAAILRAEAFEVDMVADGRVALEHLGANPPPHFVLLVAGLSGSTWAVSPTEKDGAVRRLGRSTSSLLGVVIGKPLMPLVSGKSVFLAGVQPDLELGGCV